MKELPGNYPFWHDVPLRFKDIDVGGHAHHSHALVYIEEARGAFWREIAGPGMEAVDYVVAAAELRFLQRIFYPDTLRVGLAVEKLGRKHFVLRYEVFSGEGESLVEATTTQVAFDYAAKRSKRINEDVHRKLFGYMIVPSS